MNSFSRTIRLKVLASLAILTAWHVAADGQKEFVRVSPRDPRYFELAYGRPYIPIGLNMIAPPGDGLPGMERWMEQLQTNGGNFIRVWLSNPFFDVEHVRSGDARFAVQPAKLNRIPV